MTYEVVLGPAALQVLLRYQHLQDLADALECELLAGPNADKELKFDGNAEVCSPGDAIYTATPLSVAGLTALHRPMTQGELKRLETQQRRAVAGLGIYVLDILPAESAFRRRPGVL